MRKLEFVHSTGDVPVRFEEIWNEAPQKTRATLLLSLLSGSVLAHGLFVQSESDLGLFGPIQQEAWTTIESDFVSAQVEAFGRFFLPMSDDQAGYTSILLRKDEALNNLIELHGGKAEPDPDSADVALYNARGQMFGHRAFAAAFDALYSKAIPPSPTKLANHLYYSENIWKMQKPEYDTIKSICSTIVAQYKKTNKL